MACTTEKRVDANLEAAKVKWGIKHCRIITPLADVAFSLNDTYFDLNGFDPNLNQSLYYVWYNVDSNGTDPAIAGKIAVEIALIENDSALAVATKTKAALDLLSPKLFKTEILLGNLHIQNKFIGGVTAELDSGVTGFTFVVGVDGIGLDLGATADAIEISFESNSVDITSNQTGGLIIDQISQGVGATATTNLIEVTKERIEALLGKVTGDTVTPVAGTTVTGGGESKLFKSLSSLGGMLILHPIRLPETDYSADWVFWKSAPNPASINFDGTAIQQLSVEFLAYIDPSKNKNINLYARGDWTQEGLDA